MARAVVGLPQRDKVRSATALRITALAQRRGRRLATPEESRGIATGRDYRTRSRSGEGRLVALLLARALQRRPGAGGARLVDRVPHVDVGVLLETVLHGGLRVGRVAAAVGNAHDLLVAVLDPEPLREAVVTKRSDRRP